MKQPEQEELLRRGAYITSTLNLINSYYRKAQKAKIIHQALKIAIALGSILILVVVNWPGIDNLTVIRWVVTVIGLIVAVMITIENVYNFRERWTINNSISLFIDKEYHFYQNRIIDYENLDDDMAFKLFVERIESKLADQHLTLLEKQSGQKANG